MKEKYGKWKYNSSDDGIWDSGDYYDTKEDAIEEGRKYYYEDYYVGQVEPVTAHLGIDPDIILEHISLCVYQEAGDVAESYLNYVKKEDREALEERVNTVIKDWMKENNYEPSFSKIDNVEYVSNEN